jgi:hypothetical protein
LRHWNVSLVWAEVLNSWEWADLLIHLWNWAKLTHYLARAYSSIHTLVLDMVDLHQWSLGVTLAILQSVLFHLRGHVCDRVFFHGIIVEIIGRQVRTVIIIEMIRVMNVVNSLGQWIALALQSRFCAREWILANHYRIGILFFLSK